MGKEIIFYIFIALVCSAVVMLYLYIPDYVEKQFFEQKSNQSNNKQVEEPSQKSSTNKSFFSFRRPTSTSEEIEDDEDNIIPPSLGDEPSEEEPPIFRSSGQYCNQKQCGPGTNYAAQYQSAFYYDCDCDRILSIPQEDIECFSSQEEAEQRGYQEGICDS